MTQQHRYSDAVWASIREDYLAGRTQTELVEHYQVGLSTVRDRARREGWRRKDQPPERVPPLGADDPHDAAETGVMRPILWSIADAYRKADVALRRGRAIEAQRFLTVARGFERLWREEGPLGDALSEHWQGQEEAWMLKRTTPPWPHGVRSEAEALAELPRVEAAFAAALAAGETDMDALADLIERRDRLRTCLDLLEIDWVNPPDPPYPPSDSAMAEPLETKGFEPDIGRASSVSVPHEGHEGLTQVTTIDASPRPSRPSWTLRVLGEELARLPRSPQPPAHPHDPPTTPRRRQKVSIQVDAFPGRGTVAAWPPRSP